MVVEALPGYVPEPVAGLMYLIPLFGIMLQLFAIAVILYTISGLVRQIRDKR